MRCLSLIAGCFAAVLASCTQPACGGYSVPGVYVTVTDSLSGQPAASEATLLTYDLDNGGSRIDSVTVHSDTERLSGLDDRPGHFRVVVKKSGYRDWSAPSIEVTQQCPSVIPVLLAARLAKV